MTTNLKSPSSPTQTTMDDMSNLLNLRISTPGELGQLADDELERFRKEWKQEVQAKHSVPTGGVSVGGVRWKEEARIAASSREQAEDTVGTKSSPVNVRSPLQAQRAFPPDLDGVDVGPSWRAVPPPATIKRDKHKPSTAMSSTAGTGTDRKEQAVQLYSRAVESEQAGKLNEALMLYRKAFKLDDNVDRLYARSVAKAAALALPKSGDETPTSADVVSSAAPVEEPYSFQRHIQIHPDYERAIPPPHTPSVPSPSPLTALLQSLPIPADQTQFLPSDESLPTPISILPPELIDPILAHLDVASIERFALTCWRARYLTACADVWKGIAEGIYKGPAMVPEGWMARELARRHKGEWRTTLVEEERLRMDGCYISVCHYIRPGAGEQWVTVTHMITYHRFLRFYSDGTVISFLTTDHPSEVVPLLRPSLRAKGLHFGHWRLLRPGSPEYAEHLESPAAYHSGKDNGKARVIITDLLEPGLMKPKYEFEMELSLRETGRGRWNKLDLLKYDSINLATGESLALSLKHQKPFYFSKVKSYNPPL